MLMVILKGRRVLGQGFELLEQGDVGLGYRLEEPILFEEAGVFGMSDVGKMGVQDEIQIPHQLRTSSFRS